MNAPILQDITVIIIFATISLLVCSRFKVPGIIGYLVTGLLVGPNGLGIHLAAESIGKRCQQEP